jgi:hypothetical protein
MAKKQRKAISNTQPDTLADITPIVCRLKHEAIDKELEAIKDNTEKRHEEMKSMIDSLQDNIKKDIEASNDNLKDKIVLTEKSIGEKLDKLSNFDDTLKGNGTPGVWESIRALTWKFRLMIAMLSIMLILFIGGNIKGVTWNRIRAFFGGKVESKQVEGTHINGIDGKVLKVDAEGHIIIKSKEK